MEIAGQWVKLAPLVSYDDYDTCGYLLDIRQNILVELNTRDTLLLSAMLNSETLAEALQQFNGGAQRAPLSGVSAEDVCALFKRLQEQKLLEAQIASSSSALPQTFVSPPGQKEAPPTPFGPITWKQRLIGAGHIISLLAELCKGDEGVYQAHQYIWKLKDHVVTKRSSVSHVMTLVRKEYWFYRLITGLFEHRIAHVMGQVPRNEGLCLVRACSLCVYLLPLGIPASVVIARPKYGSRDGFKLHVWVEVEGTPLNERPNIGNGYRRLYAFPFSS